jgi:hypothetical protein
MAQVYSVNAVGYVNVQVPGENRPNAAGKLAILANPLKGTNDTIATVLPFPEDGSADGVTVYRWDPAIQGYRDSATFVSGAGPWLTGPGDPNPVLPPGEGFWILNPSPTPLNITFVGDVPQGPDSNGVQIPGGNRLGMLGSKVPQAARLGFTGVAGTLEFPGNIGDTVYLWDRVTQGYRDSYTFLDPETGWLHSTETDPNGPIIQVGEGFWTLRGEAAGVWNRNFSVN